MQNLLRIVISLISSTFGLLLLFLLSPYTVNQQILADLETLDDLETKLFAVIKLLADWSFQKEIDRYFCSHMHLLLNHASFAFMTNFGLRFTLAGWYQVVKSAKSNRQRNLVDFNTVIGFSGLFVVIH